MSDLSNNSYLTFDDFVGKYFQERNILTNDLNGLNDKAFKKKYNITKNDLHKVCVKEYEKNHPSDYQQYLENYRRYNVRK